MEYNNYLYNRKTEIIQLKKDLMENNNSTIASSNPPKDYKTNEDSSSIQEHIRNIINTDIGPIFEENIRATLENYYNFKESLFPRSFIYKQLQIKNPFQIQIITNTIKEHIIQINGTQYSFQLNNDYSVSILNKNIVIKEIKDCKDKTNITINGKELVIFPHVEIEVDGIYAIDNFKLSMFPPDEVSIIFTNVKEEEIDFTFAILEIKLNKNKIGELIKQLKKDSFVFEKLSKGKIIYLGFINAEGVGSKIEIKNKLGNIKGIIYGIKSSKFCGRNIVTPVDWNLVKKVEKLEKEVIEMHKEIFEIKEKLELLINLKGIKDSKEKEKTFTKKKRNKSLSSKKEDD